MVEFFQLTYNEFKKISPYVLVGAVGAVVHRLRTEMTWKQFLGSLVISILVSLSVGVVAQEYTTLEDDIIFILCGVSGTFSKLLLDELEEILSDLSLYFRHKMGIERKSPGDGPERRGNTQDDNFSEEP